MKIFIISLISATDRRESMAKQLDALGLEAEFFDAIDGRQEPHQLFSHYDPNVRKRMYREPLTGGELGCWASHYSLWQRCVAEDIPFLILEDDILIDKKLPSLLDSLTEVSKKLTYLRLAGIFDNKYSRLVEEVGGLEVRRYTKSVCGTQAYIIYPEAARTLLDASEQWNYPVDIFLDRYWDHGILSYSVVPWLVSLRDMGSDIQRNGKPNLSKLQRLHKEWFRFLDRAKCFLFNLRNP